MKKLLSSHNFCIILGIITASLFIGFLIVKNMPTMPIVSDSADYHRIAKNILDSHSYFVIPDGLIIYPPLYPIFIALVYTITHISAYAAVYFIQYILVGILAATTFYILKKYFSVRTWIAFLGSLFILFWPYFILYSQLISSEILYIPLLIGFLASLLTITKHGSLPSQEAVLEGRRGVVIAGILLGLAILTRPVALLLVPWIIIGGFILQKFFKIPSNPLPYKKYFFVFLVALVTIIPWEIYVVAKYYRIIPVASNLSAVFDKANKTMSYLSTTAQTQHRTTGTLIVAKLKNTYLFWDPGASGYHLDIVKKQYPAVRFGILLYKTGFFILLGLAFLTVLWFRMRTNVLLMALLVTYFWALHTALFPFPRYMMPVVPFIIILAMVAIEEMIIYYGNQKTPRLHTSEK